MKLSKIILNLRIKISSNIWGEQVTAKEYNITIPSPRDLYIPDDNATKPKFVKREWGKNKYLLLELLFVGEKTQIEN